MTKKEMLVELINHYTNGNKAQFASLLGIKPQTVSAWISRDTFDAELIFTKCRGVSAEWLLTGEGIMAQCDQTSESIKKKGIPLIPFSAMAGAFPGEQQILECECERYIVPAFAGADYLIHVKGDSMQPNFNAGDIVACKNLPLGGLFFQWNKVYVLNTDQGALIKRVRRGSDAEHVLIVSDNEIYEPFELSVTAIYGISLVIGTIRLE